MYPSPMLRIATVMPCIIPQFISYCRGSRTVGELRENLSVLEWGAEDNSAELALWEEYGQLIYGDGTDSFETQYP